MNSPIKIAIVDDKVLIEDESELFSAWKPAPEVVLVKTPRIRWRKAKLPYDLWTQCVSFLRWSQRKHKEEAMIIFFYNAKLDQWAAEVFPQRPNGMTVTLLENSEKYTELRAKYDADWTQAGSVHHHCSSPAFQSGTDKHDEIDRDGVHITLGKMEDALVDIHVRTALEGTLYHSTLNDWIELPDWVKPLPNYVIGQPGFFNSLFAGPDHIDFPEEWKERIITGGPRQIAHWNDNQSMLPWQRNWENYDWDPDVRDWVHKDIIRQAKEEEKKNGPLSKKRRKQFKKALIYGGSKINGLS